jgi:hypothetical protein
VFVRGAWVLRRMLVILGLWQFSFWGGDMGPHALLWRLAIPKYCLRHHA